MGVEPQKKHGDLYTFYYIQNTVRNDAYSHEINCIA